MSLGERIEETTSKLNQLLNAVRRYNKFTEQNWGKRVSLLDLNQASNVSLSIDQFVNFTNQQLHSGKRPKTNEEILD